MITKSEKKTRVKSEESKKFRDYSEKTENRGNLNCLIEISTYGI